jgi:hypothetical protein
MGYSLTKRSSLVDASRLAFVGSLVDRSFVDALERTAAAQRQAEAQEGVGWWAAAGARARERKAQVTGG